MENTLLLYFDISTSELDLEWTGLIESGSLHDSIFDLLHDYISNEKSCILKSDPTIWMFEMWNIRETKKSHSI